MNEYESYKTAKASLRHDMPDTDSSYFAIPAGINPSEELSAESVRAAMGLMASICGEDYSASDILFVSQIKYYPAQY